MECSDEFVWIMTTDHVRCIELMAKLHTRLDRYPRYVQFVISNLSSAKPSSLKGHSFWFFIDMMADEALNMRSELAPKHFVFRSAGGDDVAI